MQVAIDINPQVKGLELTDDGVLTLQLPVGWVRYRIEDSGPVLLGRGLGRGR